MILVATSNTLEKGMNIYILAKIWLCIFGKRLWYFLMKQLTHQCPLRSVFHDFVLKSGSEKVVCENICCQAQTH